MNLDKFLNEQIARPTEQLDEGAREFFQGIASGASKLLAPLLNPLKQFVSNIFGSVKRVFFKTVSGLTGDHVYPVYEQEAANGSVYGYMYPDAVLKATGKGGGSQKATFMKVFVPNKLKGNAIKVAIDPRFLTNASRSNSANLKPKAYADLPDASESLIGKLSGELLSEVKINRDVLKTTSAAGQKETAFTKKMDATYNSTDIGIPDPQTFVDDDALNEYVSSAKVEVEHLSDILSEFLYTLAWRKSISQPVPSLLLIGFPGGGKTSLINSFGRNRFQTHVLEIASIYKEVLGGFPVVEDIYKDPALLKKFDDHVARLRGKDELAGETEFKDENGMVRTKAVKMKAADLFPAEDGKVHIFFMDEYNRDAEKMAAAMNLMLSGSIGTQYHLPKKTIVIASGNLGEDIDRVKVAKMDSATFDRYDAKVLLSRNVQRAMEFSRASTTYGGEEGISRDLPKELKLDSINAVPFEKIDQYKIDMGGLNSSLDIFFNSMIEKYGPELMGSGWEKDLSLKPLESEYAKIGDMADEDEMAYQITPRTIDKINTRLKNRAMRDWIEAKEKLDDLANPNEIEKYFLKNETTARYMTCKTPEDWERVWMQNKDEYVGRGIPSPTALYLHVMQWHDAYLPTVLRQILGGSPKKLINAIRQTAYQAVKDANQVSIADIVFGYVPKKIFGHELVLKDPDGNERKKLLDRASFMNLVSSINTMKDQVMRNLVDVISKNSSETMIKKQIEKVAGKSYDEVIAALKEKHNITIVDVKQIIILNIAVFMKDTNLTEARAASFIRRLKEFGVLVDTSTGKTTEGDVEAGVEATKAAKEAIAFIYSGLWQMSDVIKNTRFIQSGGSVDDVDGEEETGATADDEGDDSGSAAAGAPAKRGRGRPKKTTNFSGVEDEIEEGLRSIFKKML